MKIIKQLVPRVKLLMSAMQELRDDDVKLHQAIRREDVYTYNGSIFDNLTGRDISELENKGVISKLDAVSRARRLVEYNHPKLRGKSYMPRQVKGGVIRMEINKV